MSVQFSYKCSCCDKIHYGLPDVTYSAPAYYFMIPEEEREERVALDTDLCIMDEEHFFVRCVLEIPILGQEQPFGFGIWSTLSEENFELYKDTFHDDVQSHLGPFFGWFSSNVVGFEETLNLPCDVDLRDHGDRPLVYLHDGDHPLVAAQRNGITVDQALGLAEPVIKAMGHH